MTRTGIFSNPFLLGFDRIERILERASKAAQDSYPPYNIQHTGENRLRISIAVAGFAPDDLSVTQEDDLLVVRGRREESQDASFSAPSCSPMASRFFRQRRRTVF